LTYNLLKNAYGDRVHLAGNIGYPLCSVLNDLKDNDILVMEVSCQQLENMSTFHPNVALMTNLSPAHIDFLKSYDNYKRVKCKLFANQDKNDVSILNIDKTAPIISVKDYSNKHSYSGIEVEAYSLDTLFTADELIAKLKELNPCPQCGGKAFLFSYRNVIFSYININLERPHYVRCSSCFRKSENYATREEAVEAWNDCK
jgi:UDP-N-acetylmuramoylalanine-D-glutamate ligase